MATIDIRADGGEIDTIRFSDSQHGDRINKGIYGYISIPDQELGGKVIVHLKDVDNLILALKKAKELWGD